MKAKEFVRSVRRIVAQNEALVVERFGDYPITREELLAVFRTLITTPAPAHGCSGGGACCSTDAKDTKLTFSGVPGAVGYVVTKSEQPAEVTKETDGEYTPVISSSKLADMAFRKAWNQPKPMMPSPYSIRRSTDNSWNVYSNKKLIGFVSFDKAPDVVGGVKYTIFIFNKANGLKESLGNTNQLSTAANHLVKEYKLNLQP